MKIRNFGKRREETAGVIVQSQPTLTTIQNRTLSGIIRVKTFEYEKNTIETSEFKRAIDDLKNVLKIANDEKYAKLLEEFEAIYEPVKNFKKLPVVNTARKILSLGYEKQESDPESLKVIFDKCLNVQNVENEIERVKAKRENLLKES